LAGPLGETGAKIRAMSIPIRAVVLLGVSAVPGAIVAYRVFDPEDTSRFNTVVLAWLVCTASAVLALVLSLAWYGTPNGVFGALGGMFVGLGVPLGAAIIAQRKEGPLAEAGFYGWVVLFFLVALTIKTVLLAPGIDPVDPDDSLAPYPPKGPFAPRDPYGSRPADNVTAPAKKSGV
jgi:hypothetical protein